LSTSDPATAADSAVPVPPRKSADGVDAGTQRDLEPATSSLGVAPSVALPLEPQTSLASPWLFVPVLYIMQAMPVTTVQEMFAFTWKDLNVANPLIAAWTAILGLPWTLKLFWSPLVDLNSTKRRWVVAMQALIALSFLGLIWSVTLPQYAGDGPASGFYVTLLLLLLMGCLSSTHDIACDGLYILSLTKPQQAAWVGVQGTAYKLGRLLCVGALVYVAGQLHEDRGFSQPKAWAWVFGIAAVVYGAGAVWNFFFLPKPAADRPAVEAKPGENRRDIFRTVTVVAIGVCLYFLIASTIRVLGDWIYNGINASRDAAHLILKDWSQGTKPESLYLFGVPLGTRMPVVKQYAIFATSLIVMVPLVLAARRQLRGTAMAEAFGSYVRQRGFIGILAFVMFYRFGEAMVTRVLPLFLKDPIEKGGLGISGKHAGLIVGGAGVFGIILGGIIGGIVVSRFGLRKSFWPLAICMHAPNLIYLAIAMGYNTHPDPHHWQNLVLIDWPLYIAAFIHEFGYGFGFAAYFVFLMDVAQRGNFKTSHYAFGTGLGALCGVFAGITGAIILASFTGTRTYVAFFTAVCILTIPGMLTLLFIPLEPTRKQAVTA
jgi:PAT family beta-lactamase induction signal transducer AmpG